MALRQVPTYNQTGQTEFIHPIQLPRLKKGFFIGQLVHHSSRTLTNAFLAMAHHDNHCRPNISASVFADQSILDKTTVTQTAAKSATRLMPLIIEARRAFFSLFLLALGLALAGTSAAAPAVSYALTTTTDPVRPGESCEKIMC
jgi:hypothetical protein